MPWPLPCSRRLRLAAVRSERAPGPSYKPERPHPNEPGRVRRERAEKSGHPSPRGRHVHGLHGQEFSRGRDRPLGHAAARWPGPQMEGLGFLDCRLERGRQGRRLHHRVRLASRRGRGGRPLAPRPRPEERARAEHALGRHLLFQGPAVVGPLGQGRPEDDVRGEERHG